MAKFTLLESDDWQGLYIDGELEYEDHEIGIERFVSILKKYGVKIDYSDEWINHDDFWSFAVNNHFPRYLATVEEVVGEIE